MDEDRRADVNLCADVDHFADETILLIKTDLLMSFMLLRLTISLMRTLFM